MIERSIARDNRGHKFNFEEFIFKYRWPLGLFLVGAILVGFGVFLTRDELHPKSAKIEVLEDSTVAQNSNLELVVEVSGAVEKPGVYKFPLGARVEDVLIAAGGLSADADRVWMERSLNRALKLSDGQKIYIPKDGEINVLGENAGGNQTQQSSWGSGLTNINSASQKELEGLPGIGPVYAQNIIEQRPYSTTEELLNRGVLKKGVYEKIKDLITVY